VLDFLGLGESRHLISTKEEKAMQTLTLEVLKGAVATAAAFRCRRRRQPAGGDGDKVFPPTLAGAVYAIERRHVSGRLRPFARLF
jgi:hypothetical protein